MSRYIGYNATATPAFDALPHRKSNTAFGTTTDKFDLPDNGSCGILFAGILIPQSNQLSSPGPDAGQRSKLLANVYSDTEKAIEAARMFLPVSALLMALLACLFSPVDARAQTSDIFGTIEIVDWPSTRPALESGDPAPELDPAGYSLLPFIDTLTVGYRFSASPETSDAVSMRFAVDWSLGTEGILSGRRVAAADLPPNVIIDAIDLLMPVRIAGDEHAADLYLSLDSLGLAPSTETTVVSVGDVSWDSLFANTDAVRAREIFGSEFELGTPRILSITFAVDRSDARATTRSAAGRARDSRYERTVFVPDYDLWFVWSSRTDYWRPHRRSIRTSSREPREEIGRSDEGRRSSRSGRLDKILSGGDDDDDDDDDRLLPAALVGAAAVAGLAVAGGTVGYFGSVEKAPIGLMAGYVERDGGVLLQVAINRQVFGKAEGPENLVASVTSFYKAFHFPIQPAVGLGVRLTEEGTTSVAWKPSVSVGVVGNFGRILLLAGYDLTTPDFRVGTAVNFRSRR